MNRDFAVILTMIAIIGCAVLVAALGHPVIAIGCAALALLVDWIDRRASR